jgi:2-polyprenyl-3-methyl-5-hydroxy-6-metoxy-1,4-benzoquinol methylase
MALGPFIRKLFGPHERNIAEIYRRLFVDLNQFASVLHTWVPNPRRVLEVGCGEGAMTERLARVYPSASITAIDICPTIGRLYGGPRECVQFLQRTIAEIAASHPASFDLVILADVIHHVPLDQRIALLESIRAALAPSGVFVFKDWLRTETPIHAVVVILERYVTGDKVSYFSHAEIIALSRQVFGDGSIADHATISPWRNNLALCLHANSVIH